MPISAITFPLSAQTANMNPCSSWVHFPYACVYFCWAHNTPWESCTIIYQPISPFGAFKLVFHFSLKRVLKVPSLGSPFSAWTWLCLFWPARLARQVEFLFIKMKTFQSSDRLNQGFPLGVGVRGLHFNKLPSDFTHPGVADHVLHIGLLHDPR